MSFYEPLRLDRALTNGSLSREMARSTYFRKPFPRVALARKNPLTMAVRARAAGLVDERAVVAGVAAAALHGAEVAPPDPVVDLVVGVDGVREAPGFRRRRLRLGEEEITAVAQTRVTTPARTAYDVARWLPRGDAVVVLAAHGDDRDRASVEPVLLEWHLPRPRDATGRCDDGRSRIVARGR